MDNEPQIIEYYNDWGCHGELDWINVPNSYDVIKYIKKLQEENEKLKKVIKETKRANGFCVSDTESESDED